MIISKTGNLSIGNYVPITQYPNFQIMEVQIQIDGKTFTVPEGLSVRKAAFKNGIYIPGICGHPALPPVREVRWVKEVHRGDEVIAGDFTDDTAADIENCNLCLVAVEDETELKRACETKAKQGMVVRTHGADIAAARRKALTEILAHHPHACLTCAQREGCSLTQCSANVPEDERCCPLLNRCELGRVVDYIGLPDDVPKYVPENFPKLYGDPFFDRDYNLCISCLRCVRVCNDVRGVKALGATLKNERIWVGTIESGELKESYCRFCGACVEVCPTGALRDKPDSVPVLRGEAPPCVEACPAGIDIPAYVRRIAEGDFAGALEVIYEKVPFPGILGYVCFHPCEDVCKRETLDESVSVCALKRFVYENTAAGDFQSPSMPQRTGKKAAVIGSGPAGLTAAYYLARAGHEVEVYEFADKPGGMLRNAIPLYRLPESVLDRELEPLFSLGVKFHTGRRMGRDFKLAELLESDCDAVLLAIGTTQPRMLGVPGENLEGVSQALELLKSVRQGKSLKLKGKVVVIGGGNVAVDAAMTALRLEADEATMVCLESRDEIPAHAWELEQATQEGVEVMHGWGPVEFISSNGRLSRVKFKRCTRVFDDDGNFNPQYDKSETTIMEADHVIIAIGQKSDEIALDGISVLNFERGGILNVDEDTLATSFPGLYAAGDIVTGPTSVIRAVAMGRKAADSIDKFLGGKGIDSGDREVDEVRDNPFIGRDEDFHRRHPVRPSSLDPVERVKDFSVIEETYSELDAAIEAQRCLNCHLRAAIVPPLMPPDKWQPLKLDVIAKVPVVEGVYQIADAAKKVTKIAGTVDIRAALGEELEAQSEGALFCWEEDKMYSKRESELIQRHLQAFGEMPGGGADDLDDLF